MRNLITRISHIPFNNLRAREDLLLQLWQECGNSGDLTPEQERFIDEVNTLIMELKRQEEAHCIAAQRYRTQPWLR